MTVSSSPAAEFRAGAAASSAPTLALVPFALLLGGLAAAKGFTPLETALMSALVFAGSAQFAAIDTWTDPAPWLALAGLTLVVNLRHVLMSASVLRRMERFPRAGRALAMLFLADEVWAFAEARAARQPLTPAYFAGLALPFYACWVAAGAAGNLLGQWIADPRAWGFDFAFVAIFIVLIRGFRAQPGFATALIASAAAATAIDWVHPGPASIIGGTIAGIAAAAIAHKPETAQ
ncbi:AzlC family ABC transporter permease [Oleispirillum naphthae]|uniref:AzlC family ABC transporter permease n=1 Tax=Oleispirillum naphthae TaxID=2838853 RepID=UPI00308262A7